jgi:tetratricopeptide (TPR) repeat protein
MAAFNKSALPFRCGVIFHSSNKLHGTGMRRCKETLSPATKPSRFAELLKSQLRSAHKPKSFVRTRSCKRVSAVARLVLAAACASPFAVLAQCISSSKGPAELEKVLASHPLAPAYNALGTYLGRQSRVAYANSTFESPLSLTPDSWGLEINPHSNEARFQLALALRSLGEKEPAGEDLNAVQEQNEQSIKQDVAGDKENQANEHMKEGNLQSAITSYRQSIAQDPNNSHNYYALALVLDQTGDVSGERDALQKAVKLNPSFAPAHNQLGMLDLREGRTQDAEAQLNSAISLDPQYAEAQNNLGELYGQLGDKSAAESLFLKATENNPKYVQAYVNLGLVLASESRFPEASQVLEKATLLDPKSTTALTALAKVLVRLNRNSEAVPYLRKVLEFSPASSDAHLNLGIALADQLDLNGALAEFSQAVLLEPNSSAAHYNKGRALLDLRRLEEAKMELETATRVDPKSAESWYLLGMLARQEGNTAESVRQFRKVVGLDPQNVKAIYLLGQQLLHEGDTSGAIEQWRKVIEIEPENSEALYNLSRLLRKPDPEEANRLEARFHALQAEQQVTDRAQTLGNLALASASANDWPEAISQLKEALRICGKCSALPLLHKDLGLIYCHSGDFKNGRAELLTAQKLSPSDADITKVLQLLSSTNR